MPQPRSGDFDLPGVTRSRQKRSREMTLALLQAGAEMLRTRSLAELSIEALCSEVGATVGAFYSRFESKEAYFNALIELAARDGEGRLTRLSPKRPLPDQDLAGLSRLFVHGLIAWSRSHEGVLRAALQHEDTRPNRWTTFKRLAGAAVAEITPALLRAIVLGPRPVTCLRKRGGCCRSRPVGRALGLIRPGPLARHDGMG